MTCRFGLAGSEQINSTLPPSKVVPAVFYRYVWCTVLYGKATRMLVLSDVRHFVLECPAYGHVHVRYSAELGAASALGTDLHTMPSLTVIGKIKLADMPSTYTP